MIPLGDLVLGQAAETFSGDFQTEHSYEHFLLYLTAFCFAFTPDKRIIEQLRLRCLAQGQLDCSRTTNLPISR